MRQIRLLFSLIAALAAVACSGRDQGGPLAPQTGTVSAPNTQAQSVPQGGVDSSGGETPRSERELIEATVNRQIAHLPVAYRRLKMFFDEVPQVRARSVVLLRHIPHLRIGETSTEAQKNQFLYLFDEKALRLMQRLFSSRSGEFDLFARIRTMRFQYQEEPCTGEFSDPRDMSIRPNGEVCVSLKRLHFIPPQHLDVQILALLAMESSHLMGFDRTDATALRDWFLAHLEVVAENRNDFDHLEKILWDSLGAQSSYLEMSMRHYFGLDQILGTRASFLELGLDLAKKLFLERRTIRLPKLLEEKLYTLYYSYVLEQSSPTELANRSIISPEDRDKQVGFGRATIQRAHQTLAILNLVRDYRHPDRAALFPPWRFLEKARTVEIGAQNYSRERFSVPTHLVECRLRSNDGRLDFRSTMEWLGPETNGGREVLNRFSLPVHDIENQPIGTIELDAHAGTVTHVRALFKPTNSPEAWTLTVQSAEGAGIRPFTSEEEAIPYFGVIGFLDQRGTENFRGHWSIESKTTRQSQSLEMVCRTQNPPAQPGAPPTTNH